MRQNKGFDLAVAVKENKDLRKQIKELQATIDELKGSLVSLAEADAKKILELQAKVETLEKSCAVYRANGIVNLNRVEELEAEIQQAEETVTVRGQDIPISDFIKNKEGE